MSLYFFTKNRYIIYSSTILKALLQLQNNLEPELF